jgi:hypothetical protein
MDPFHRFSPPFDDYSDQWPSVCATATAMPSKILLNTTKQAIILSTLRKRGPVNRKSKKAAATVTCSGLAEGQN